MSSSPRDIVSNHVSDSGDLFAVVVDHEDLRTYKSYPFTYGKIGQVMINGNLYWKHLGISSHPAA
jgi:hypothetical protein